MSLKNIAKETLKILPEGKYTNNSEKVINFSLEQQEAKTGTRLYTPE